jgi:hypothetical protein
MIEGTITPATPTVAALPRKLRLEIPEFFMLVSFVRNNNYAILKVRLGTYSNVNNDHEFNNYLILINVF